MANARANIYPIQLQGAELNLNKYNAEIKQYSGFNKNNSPFVGGGLSPIFRKDETVEDATSKNTYIAPNGDVYRVDYSGFYKNDVKVIDYNNGSHPETISSETHSRFIDCDVLPKYQNGKKVIWYYTNNIYIYLENQHYYINGVDLGIPNSFYTEEQVATVLTTCVCPTNQDVYICSFISGTFTYLVFNRNGTLLKTQSLVTEYTDDFDNKVAMTIFTHYNYTRSFTAVLTCLDSNSDRKIVAFRVNYSSSTWSLSTPMAINDTLVISDAENHPNYKAASMSLSDYHFCSYPENMIYAKFTQDYDNGSTDTRLYIGFRVYNHYFNNSDLTVYFSNNDVLLDNVYISSVNKVTKSTENNALLTKEYEEAFFSSQYCSYVFHAFINDNYDTVARGVNCSSAFTANDDNGKTRVKTSLGYVHKLQLDILNFYHFLNSDFKQESYSSFCVLFNGNRISGLGLYYSDILLTEWNNLDLKYLGFMAGDIVSEAPSGTYVNYKYIWSRRKEDALCIKQGEDFYYIHSGTPKLKLVNNQLVTNVFGFEQFVNSNVIQVQTPNNSYLIDEDKIIKFATRFNNAFKGNTLFFSQGVTNNLFIAASRNEYRRKYNSSILINPTNVVNLNGVSVDVDYVNDINFYRGEDVAVYVNTCRKTVTTGDNSSLIISNYYFIDNDLIGLPFPSNSNGNVEYSPNIFSEIKSFYGNNAFIKSGGNFYPLMKENNAAIMSFYLASGIEGLQESFIIQGQFYGIINNGLYSIRYNTGVAESIDFIVSVEGLKFCGNTPYQAFFFSKTNRCLYIFNGANVLQQSQFIDIYSDIKFYKYNPATHSIFMVTDDCVLVFSSFGTFRLDVPDVEEIFLLENGVVFLNNVGTFMRIKYYNTEDGYTKQNVILETCFYGMNNQTVTINDCLYMRLFSEEHESGDIEVSAVTLSNEGKKTERTTFKITPSDWDKETHSIYLRYQPKEQRGLGISFKINSPFKICSLSVGSIADAILIDKVSKGAINAPYNNKSSIEEW